ncbi:MAG: PhzF family phenazine biosynthesis protein [Terriglobia bacterium]
MAIRIIQVDAFTAEPFRGNPAAVCVLAAPRDEAWMQDVAREMNLSETAFLFRTAEGFDLRWFTPAVEVALCGHATLASAHVLWEDGHLKTGEQARFHTKSGPLTAEFIDGWIDMNFPAKLQQQAAPPEGLIQALAVTPKYVGRNQFDYLLEVESERAVRSLRPDFAALKKIGARGIMVTSRSDSPGFDFVSRFFAPASGIDEDPVTGSAHCCLGPFWAERLGKMRLTAFQASSRTGEIRLTVEGDRVHLAGQAVTVFRGELV